MIRMIKGNYGLMVDGVVKAMTPDSPPFSLTEKREAELIEMGVAVKVEEPAKERTYADMDAKELREIAAAKGVDVTAAKSKRKIIALLEAADKAAVPEEVTEENS